MDIHKHRSKVAKNVASLPGSRDRVGGPVIVIDPPIDGGRILTRTSSSPEVAASSFPYEDLVSLLGYFAEIADKSAASKGFVVLVDARKVPPKALKSILRACQQALYKKIRLALIVQPDKFLNQQKINVDLILEGYDFRTVLLSVHKLSKYIDISQLTEQFGGTFVYEPEQWSNERERIEAILLRLFNRKQDFITPNYECLPLSNNEEAFKDAEALATELTQNSHNHDHQAASDIIKKAIEDVKMAATRPEREAIEQKKVEEAQEKNRMLEEHAEGVNRLLDWIEGAGERWLLTLHEIGESKDEARQLMKEHQQLAAKSKELINTSEELAELSSRLMAAVPAHAITLEKARDQVRVIAEQFSNRVNRQMDMARRSEEFHTLTADLTRKTDLLLECLCTDPRVTDLAGAEVERAAMEEKVAVMDKIYETVCNTGGSFIEDLASSEFRTAGRKVVRDYSAGIAHINDQLASARERRRRCLDLVDVRRLKLQQFVQLYTCENDANQAIKWLEELHDTLLKDYNQVGCDENDLQCLREDRMKLEETARSTYEYGKQLCQVGMVLRRSLRLDALPQTNITEKLEQTWGRLCRALSDNEAKLNVTDAFNSTIVEIRRRIEEIEKKAKDILPGRDIESILAVERRRLSEDIRELSHIKDMLSTQINANHNAPVEARQHAITGIRRKVDGIEDRYRRMESLFTESPTEQKEETYHVPQTSNPVNEKESLNVLLQDMQRQQKQLQQDLDDELATIRQRPSINHSIVVESLPERNHHIQMRNTTYGVGSIRLSDTESYL
ncbi:unnamed protein product [Auanema sp. JU1783]|nr:unnamed protein product [Auanema sp. JU1783]